MYHTTSRLDGGDNDCGWVSTKKTVTKPTGVAERICGREYCTETTKCITGLLCAETLGKTGKLFRGMCS